MRELGKDTICKRGCDCCGDAIHEKWTRVISCPHDVCPYKDLDGIENWKQYDAPARKRSARATKGLGRKVVEV